MIGKTGVFGQTLIKKQITEPACGLSRYTKSGYPSDQGIVVKAWDQVATRAAPAIKCKLIFDDFLEEYSFLYYPCSDKRQ